MNFMSFTRSVREYLAEDSEINSFAEASESSSHVDADPSARLIRVAEEHQISPQELAARVSKLNDYISSCEERSPAPWSVVGLPFDAPSLARDLATGLKLSAYYAVIQHVLAYHLPNEKKGYVGCIDALTYPYTAVGYLERPSADDPCHEDMKCIEATQLEQKFTSSQTTGRIKNPSM